MEVTDSNPLAGKSAADAMNEYNDLNKQKTEDLAKLESKKFTLEKKSDTEEYKEKYKVAEQRDVIEDKVAKKETPPNPFGLI